jgi:hypothetical protein
VFARQAENVPSHGGRARIALRAVLPVAVLAGVLGGASAATAQVAPAPAVAAPVSQQVAATDADPGIGSALSSANPSFTIYYSPNCTGASRTYYGKNDGEKWINDRFNSTAAGSAGNGQRIYHNAASAHAYGSGDFGGTELLVEFDAGFYADQILADEGCQNLQPKFRNMNESWQLH